MTHASAESINVCDGKSIFYRPTTCMREHHLACFKRTRDFAARTNLVESPEAWDFALTTISY